MMPVKNISRRKLLRTIGAGAAGATGLMLAGCRPAAPAAAPSQSAAPTAAGAAATGDYQGKFVMMSAGNADQNAPLIKGIEEANPGVKVEWRFLPSERYVELFTAAEVAGDQIDIMDLNGQDLRRYAVGGKLRDLSNIEYKSRFRDVAINTYKVAGKNWALPRGGISGFTFLTNKKAFAKVGFDKEPSTYEELKTLAPEMKKAGIAMVSHPGKNIYLWPVWQFWAYGQTSGNKSIENTMKTLAGEMKFTAAEHVAGLETLYNFANDGMFIDGVNSLEGDAAWLPFTQGKAAIHFMHTFRIGAFRTDQAKMPELDMSLIAPVRVVGDDKILRQMPGGTGNATGVYAKIKSEREQAAMKILDLMTSDKWVKWANELGKDPVSCNANVEASTDELALKYSKECSANQTTYLDWMWPPEITRSFQENQQALVAGTKKPNEAAESIQKTLDGLYKDGYKFQQ